ncbi:MAG TPA: TlpA disulfide reductase family protein [Anaerolineales bacterium]|nr:TlpA disulfide reductase family protein [Anaerolineales bacterium]
MQLNQQNMTESKLLLQSRKMLSLVFLGFGLILIIISTYFIWRDSSSQTNFSIVPVKVNYASPELTLTDIQGVTHSLADYRGQVVLINLWATWCPPCKEEMPTLQSFYNKHKEQGFAVVAINDGDPTKDVLQFVKDYQLTFPVWLDPTYIATEQAFKSLNLPTSFVIDRNGVVQLQWVGGISRKMLDQYVIPLITEQQ